MATTLTVVHNSTCTRCRPVRGFFVVAVVVFIHSENITKMSSQTKYTLDTKITVLGNPASKPNHTVPLRTRCVPVAAALRVWVYCEWRATRLRSVTVLQDYQRRGFWARMSVLTQVLLVPRQSLWTDPPVLVLQEAQLCRVVAFRFFSVSHARSTFRNAGFASSMCGNI